MKRNLTKKLLSSRRHCFLSRRVPSVDEKTRHCLQRKKTKNARCAIHYWATGRRIFGKLGYCPCCNIHICLDCFYDWHTIAKLEELKDAVSKSTKARSKKHVLSELKEACLKKEAVTDLTKKRATAVTDINLEIGTGMAYSDRVDFKTHYHFPVKRQGKDPKCAIHRWANGKIVHGSSKIVKCQSCEIHLCRDCFELFHNVENVEELRAKVCNIE